MRLVSLLAAVIAVSGCGSSTHQEGGTTPPPADPAATAVTPAAPVAPPAPQPVEVSVRAIHVAATVATKNLGVTYATGGDAPGRVATDLPFGAAGTYTSATLPPGVNMIGLSVSAEGLQPFTHAGPITAGEPHTAIVMSAPDDATQLSATVLRDSAQAPDASKTRVRFVHALVGWDAVDVCSPGADARAAGTPVFPSVPYGQATRSQSPDEYVDMPAGVTKVQVRQANVDAPCAGRVLGGADLAAPAGVSLGGQNVTLVAVGRATGRPAVPRALLLCLDSPAPAPSCTSLRMTAR